jgi:glycosyltransferase involved in cell wall biosynthesis
MHPLNRLAEIVLMPDAVKLADRIIADSHSTAEKLAKEFPKTKGIVSVAHLGVTTLPRPKERQSLLEFGVDRPYWLFVGTLEPRKNLPRLLRAYAKLSPEIRKNYLMVIAGGKGWGNQDLASLIFDLGLKDFVRLTGRVNEEELATLYQHAQFLAMPSIEEGFGLPILEAMSFGVPVLTSCVSSLPEVAGDAGLLIDPLDMDAIAQGIRRMLEDVEFRDSLARRTQANVDRFGWDKTAKQIMDVFSIAIHDCKVRMQHG